MPDQSLPARLLDYPNAPVQGASRAGEGVAYGQKIASDIGMQATRGECRHACMRRGPQVVVAQATTDSPRCCKSTREERAADVGPLILAGKARVTSCTLDIARIRRAIARAVGGWRPDRQQA
jgi:hypothetical protein